MTNLKNHISLNKSIFYSKANEVLSVLRVPINIFNKYENIVFTDALEKIDSFTYHPSKIYIVMITILLINCNWDKLKQ